MRAMKRILFLLVISLAFLRVRAEPVVAVDNDVGIHYLPAVPDPVQIDDASLFNVTCIPAWEDRFLPSGYSYSYLRPYMHNESSAVPSADTEIISGSDQGESIFISHIITPGYSRILSSSNGGIGH